MDIIKAAENARKASIIMGGADAGLKNHALEKIANALLENEFKIIEANTADLERSKQENLASPLLKRLKFDHDKITDVCAGIKSLINLEDPVGRILAETELDD